MLDLLGACDSEPKQPNAILNLIVIFPLACPKSQKQQKRNPPRGEGVPFWHLFFMEVFSRAKAQPSSRTGLGEAEESGRSLPNLGNEHVQIIFYGWNSRSQGQNQS